MEGEGGRVGPRMSKRFNGGEVDYNNKAGTAWSHSFLNQKPWHPLSYPNQRRKWIAEQTHAQRDRRAEEVAREFAQEQDFFRQTALVSQREKEKMEMMKAVSFMYVRPPGYNAESAKAAEVADESRKDEEGNQQEDGTSTPMPPPSKNQSRDDKKKSVPKDVFGRALPTEEQFEVLKNAPRLETGAPARVKPFAVEVRNVKCLRCGNFGHQSGDRECPLKDAIMPNEESRLQRDDPLTAMMAHAESSEPLKWELKQKPGMSPPRGGFDPDDPNQQIVAEDIFDEYGGFLGGQNIPDLLANFTSSKPKKKSKSKHKHKRRSSPSGNKSRYDKVDDSSSDDDDDTRRKSKKRRQKNKRGKHSEPSSSDHDDKVRKNEAYGDDDDERPGSRSRSIRINDSKIKHGYFAPSSSDHDKKNKAYDNSDDERTGSRSNKRENDRTKYRHSEPNYSSGDGESDKRRTKSRHRRSYLSDDSRPGSPIGKKFRYNEEGGSSSDDERRSKKKQYNPGKSKHFDSSFSSQEKIRQNVAYDDNERTRSRSKKRNGDGIKHSYHELNYSSGDGEYDKHRKRRRHRRSYPPDDSAFDERQRSKHRESSRNR